MKYIFAILSFSFFLLFATSATAQTNPVLHFSFDELNENRIKDHSKYSNRGTNYEAELIPGIKGNALSFDGINDYARIPGDGEDPPPVLADLDYGSISVWFKADNIPTEFGIAPILYYGSEEMCNFFDAANQGVIIELGHSPIHYASESLYFTMWKNGCTYPSFCYDSRHAVSTGEWHHFVAVVGKDYNTGYLDGKLMTGRRYNFGTRHTSQFFADAVVHEKFWLGKGHWDRTTQHFDGAIDELRIYDRPLSEEEVLELYNEKEISSVNGNEESRSGVKIYPNPAKEILNYELQEYMGDFKSLKITDISGRILLSETENLSGKLDISGLSTEIGREHV